MHQIRKADVISINGSPCHCRRLKTGAGFCTVIRRSISIGKPQKCRSVPFRISRIKHCRLRTIFFFDPEKILSNHLIRFIPGHTFEFPASFFSNPLHRIQDPVFVINILPGSSSFGTQSPTLSRKIPTAFYRHKLSFFYISIDRTSRRTDITADFFYYSLIHAVSPINVSMFIRTFYYNKLLFSFLSIFQISVFLKSQAINAKLYLRNIISSFCTTMFAFCWQICTDCPSFRFALCLFYSFYASLASSFWNSSPEVFHPNISLG